MKLKWAWMAVRSREGSGCGMERQDNCHWPVAHAYQLSLKSVVKREVMLDIL